MLLVGDRLSAFNFIYKIKLKSNTEKLYLTVYKQKEFKNEDDVNRYVSSMIKTLSLPSDLELENIELYKNNLSSSFTKYILSKINR